MNEQNRPQATNRRSTKDEPLPAPPRRAALQGFVVGGTIAQRAGVPPGPPTSPTRPTSTPSPPMSGHRWRPTSSAPGERSWIRHRPASWTPTRSARRPCSLSARSVQRGRLCRNSAAARWGGWARPRKLTRKPGGPTRPSSGGAGSGTTRTVPTPSPRRRRPPTPPGTRCRVPARDPAEAAARTGRPRTEQARPAPWKDRLPKLAARQLDDDAPAAHCTPPTSTRRRHRPGRDVL